MIPRHPGPIVRATEAVATTVKSGQFVSWPASKGEARGMVVSVHKTKVPGVPHVQEGTADAPAARVQLFAKVGKKWEATTAYLGLPVSSLTAIDPLPLVEAATEAVVPGSFDEIRQLVRHALCDRIEAIAGVRPDLYLYDLGATWAVYCIGWSDDNLQMVEYSIDNGTVTLGDAVEVRPITLYQVVADAAEAVTDELGARVIEASEGTSANGGRIFHILMIRYGDSKNNRRYPESVMREAAPLYEGSKAYDHHRTQSELDTSTISGLIGTFLNVTATAVGLEADLHLLPSATHAAEALDMALANQAAGLDPLIGVSQDVMARWKPISVAGRSMQEATEILSVNSVDVVAHPAAGGQATRMVAAGDPNTHTTPHTKENHPVNLKQLLALLRAAESDAQRTALLLEHASVLEAAGLTAEDATRMAEAVPAPAPAPVTTVAPATEATAGQLTKASIFGRLAVATAVKTAGLPDQMVESIITELPEQFTEADVTAKVASTARLLEHFEKQGLAPTIPARESKVVADELDKKIKALDQMFAGNMREGYHSLKRAYLDIAPAIGNGARVDPLSHLLPAEILRESHVMTGGRTFDSERGVESVNSATWGEILGDSITRRMVAEYAHPSLQTWRQIVSSIKPLADFRLQHITRLGGYGVLPTVLQGAPYQNLTSPTDEEATYAPAKKGGIEDLTLEAIANDDLGAVQAIPRKLGQAAGQTLYRFVWDLFPTNAAIYDSVALFDAAHSNTATDALSGTALAARRKAMQKQAAYGDTYDVLSLTPKYLAVVSDLEELAFQLATSAVALPTGAPVGAATNIPNLHQGITPIVVPYWASTTGWFVIADPAQCPTIELGFYGQEDPALFVQSDPTNGSAFNADKVTWKVRHIYGGGVVDYRGFQRGNA